MGRDDTLNAPGGEADWRRALAAADERFKSLVERTADAIVVVDQEGVVQFVNPSAELLFGSSDQALTGTLFGFPTVEGVTTEVDVRGGDGVRIAEMRVVETVWEGRPAYLASLRDIEDRKRLEEEWLARAREEASRRQAEEANRLRDQFLATVSHELRAPLQSILAWTELMRRDPDDREKVEQGLGVIERSAATQQRILEDLMDVSRVIGGKLRLRLEPVDSEQAVEQVVGAFRLQAEEQGVTLRAEAVKGAPVLRADPDRLRQILSNLIANAIEHTPEGGAVRLEADGEPETAVFRVADSGRGIPAEDLETLFEPFRQGHDPQGRGLGLGLSIVRQLVGLHGGRVEAESEGVGKGSTFVVRLPVAGPDGG